MNWITDLFNRVNSFFKKIFSPEFAGAIAGVLEDLAPLVNAAYPIVKQLAALTPTMLDDGLVALYERYGIKDLFDENKSKDIALRDLSKELVRQNFPDVSESSLNTAVELAYKTLKQQMTDGEIVVDEVSLPTRSSSSAGEDDATEDAVV